MMRGVLALLVLLTASAALAETRRVRPDGQIRFEAAMAGPTRISVKGARIKSVIQSDSQFEMANDEDTGDVFLRYIGTSTDPESGYLVTESGHTVGFTMTPRAGLATQSIIIHLIGVAPEGAEPGEEDASGAFAVSDGAGDSYAGQLAAITTEAIRTRIGSKPASKGGGGQVRKGRLTAQVFVAKAGASRPSPQSFYTAGTLAVWVDDVVSNGKVWVVRVEARK